MRSLLWFVLASLSGAFSLDAMQIVGRVAMPMRHTSKNILCKRYHASKHTQNIPCDTGEPDRSVKKEVRACYKDISSGLSNPCQRNSVFERVIDFALEYPHDEGKYALAIRQFHEAGWDLNQHCCNRTQLHRAVAHNLCHIAEAFITSDSIVHGIRDDKNRTPLHYVKTLKMAKLFLNGHTFCTVDLHARDCDGNTPLHLVPAPIVELFAAHGADMWRENNISFVGLMKQTPARKAVAEADVAKCAELFGWKDSIPTADEYELLHHYIKIRLYETADKANAAENRYYRQIGHLLEETRRN